MTLATEEPQLDQDEMEAMAEWKAFHGEESPEPEAEADSDRETALARLEPWRATDFTIGDVDFHISKKVVEDAFDLWEEIRVAVTANMQGRIIVVSPDNPMQPLFEAATAFLALPKTTKKALRNKIFASIQAKGPNTGGETVRLAPEQNLGRVFSSLNPAAIEEVFLRGLVVNFFDSLESVRQWPVFQQSLTK